MKISSLVLSAGLALAAASATPSAASAAFDGWTVRGTSQRAGPGQEYPRIGYIPGGVHVRIFGCIHGLRYCDVGWRGDRGWVRGSALHVFYHGRRAPLVRYYVPLGIPYIAFGFGYWDDHYRDRWFFHDRHKWWKDRDRDDWDRDDWKKSGDWKNGDQPRPSQFPRKKQWDEDELGMNDEGSVLKGPGPVKQGMKRRWCGPNSDNPECAEMNQ
jgi:uncharacterized protein YraI